MRWKGEDKWVPHKVKSPATEGQCQQVRDYLAFASKEAKEEENQNSKDGCFIQ